MNRSSLRPRSAMSRWLRLGGQQFSRLQTLIAPSDLDITERNTRHLYLEIFWAAFLAAAATFNALFAVRLGATNTEVGLLSSIPALAALLVTIPAGQIINRQAKRMPIMLWTLFLHRLGFLLVIFIPWLPIGPKGAILIWLLIVFSVPAQIFGVGWNWLLGEIIPEVNRARVLAIRNILAAISTTTGIFVAGRWLDHGPFPLSYQAMYLVGFIASMISLYYIFRLQVSDSVVPGRFLQADGKTARRNLILLVWDAFRGLPATFREAIAEQPDFMRMVINTLAHGIGLWLIGPLYVLYYVRTLGASDGWIGLNGTLASLMPVLGFYLWQRGIIRWGENRVLKWSIGLVGLYPVLVGLSPNLTLILVWTAVYGLINPGVALSHYSMLLKVCPAAERPRYLGVYTAIMNLAAFVMPLVGVQLANRVGFAPLLVTGGLVCLLGSNLFRWRPLQTPDSLAVRQAELTLRAAQ